MVFFQSKCEVSVRELQESRGSWGEYRSLLHSAGAGDSYTVDALLIRNRQSPLSTCISTVLLSPSTRGQCRRSTRRPSLSEVPSTRTCSCFIPLSLIETLGSEPQTLNINVWLSPIASHFFWMLTRKAGGRALEQAWFYFSCSDKGNI